MPEFSASFRVISLFIDILHSFYSTDLEMIQQSLSLLVSCGKQSDFEYVESDDKIQFWVSGSRSIIKYDLGFVDAKN